MSEVTCPYCQRPALRMTGSDLHPSRSDLTNNHYWVCRNCDAWVGCHKPGWEPLGRLANAELRRAKQEAHAAFDPIWKNAMSHHGWTMSKARNLAYTWLTDEMNIERSQAHIGEFDLDQCKLTVLICQHREPNLLALSQKRAAEVVHQRVSFRSQRPSFKRARKSF